MVRLVAVVFSSALSPGVFTTGHRRDPPRLKLVVVLQRPAAVWLAQMRKLFSLKKTNFPLKDEIIDKILFEVDGCLCNRKRTLKSFASSIQNMQNRVLFVQGQKKIVLLEL